MAIKELDLAFFDDGKVRVYVEYNDSSGIVTALGCESAPGAKRTWAGIVHRQTRELHQARFPGGLGKQRHILPNNELRVEEDPGDPGTMRLTGDKHFSYPD